MKKHVGFRLEESKIQKLKDYAWKQRKTVSKVIQELIEKLIKSL